MGYMVDTLTKWLSWEDWSVHKMATMGEGEKPFTEHLLGNEWTIKRNHYVAQRIIATMTELV